MMLLVWHSQAVTSAGQQLLEAGRREGLALNVAIDTVREETPRGGGAAQVHNGQNLSRGAGEGNVV